LAKANDFLRQENKILRSKLGKRVPLTESDRRTLVRYGMPIKDRLREVISIVCPETLLAWKRRMKRRKWTFDNTPKRPDRAPKAKATEALVLRMARETAWGYVRIAGELKKLGHEVSPSCVRDLMKKHGIPPSPHRKGLSWKQFIQAHLEVTWAADFFTEEVGCTPQPEARWRQQQARNFSLLVAENARQASYLIHDRDGAFFPLDQVLHPAGIKVIKTPPQSPMCNAYAERFVRETRETLDPLILLGEGHLRQVLKKIEHHHNQQRPHQGLDNVIPLDSDCLHQPAPSETGRCDSALGGLLNHYYAQRVAA
jgi:putative transposase